MVKEQNYAYTQERSLAGAVRNRTEQWRTPGTQDRKEVHIWCVWGEWGGETLSGNR